MKSPRRIRGRKFFDRDGGKKKKRGRRESERGKERERRQKKEIFSPRLT